MNSNIENVKNYIPPNNTGYEYIKHELVYVPVKDVGLEILERQWHELSFLYKTILSFVSLGITDIEVLAKQLGLEQPILIEIISQMASNDLLFISDSCMGSTSKGTKALSELEKVTIHKDYLNNVYVNMITGKILNDKPPKTNQRPRPSSMYLDQTFNIDVGFFRKQLSQVKELYQQNFIDETQFGSNLIDKELYRLLNIDYDNTLFIELSCFVFVHPESGELLLSFEGDNDAKYLATAMEQIRGGFTGAMKIFDASRESAIEVKEFDLAKQSALNDLISILELREKSKVSEQEIEEKYYTNRYLLSGEAEEIVSACSYIKPKTVVLSLPSARTFLESNEIIFSLKSSNIERLILIYNEDEYNVGQSIDWLKSSIAGEKLKIECYPQPAKSSIVDRQVLAYPGFLISTSYENISVNCGVKRLIKKEISDITFDDSAIFRELNGLFQRYSIPAEMPFRRP